MSEFTITLVGVVITAIAAIASWIGVVPILRDLRRKRAEEIASASPYLSACTQFSFEVAKWFKFRFEKFEEFAKSDGLRGRDAALQRPVLERLAREVLGFPGGIYAITDEKVSAQYTPHAPDVPDITGWPVDARPYYEPCKQLLRTVTSHVFHSMNRKKTMIIVVATPRFSDSDQFIGILDGVVDIASAPFSEMARKVLYACGLDEIRPRAQLILIDENYVVMGSSHGAVDGTTNVGGNKAVLNLRNTLSQSHRHSSDEGAIFPVEGTPYFAVCHKLP